MFPLNTSLKATALNSDCALCSVVLHELYFANLSGDPKPGGKALDAIKQWFGSYE